MSLSLGKQAGLQVLADDRGVIRALALDQRTALRKLIAGASGQRPEEIDAELLIQFKEHVSSILTRYASAILLDPEYGLPAAAKRDKKTGLLLACEKSGYDKSVRGRLPTLLDGYSVARLQNEGADAIKALLYYSPFSSNEINTKKYVWVQHVGAECQAAHLPFFLELVSYHDDMDEKGPEFARIKPDVVTRSVQEFCKPRYAVDVLKIGVPVNMNFVESATLPRSQALYSRDEARSYFQRASEAASLPFIYLSEGVSNERFGDALEIAAEARSAFSGVLCGRAIWQEGVPIFMRRGASALDDWLMEEGYRNMQNVNRRLSVAHPWFEKIAGATRSEV